jgi:hypothetical protein
MVQLVSNGVGVPVAQIKLPDARVVRAIHPMRADRVRLGRSTVTVGWVSNGASTSKAGKSEKRL